MACSPIKELKAKNETASVPMPEKFNHIAQVAQNAGATECLPRINQVSGFLINGNPNNSVAFFMPSEMVNTHMLSTSFEIHTPQTLSYVGAYFAPRPNGGCDGAYEAIAYWPNNCEATAKKQFKQYQPLGKIHQSVLAFSGGPQLRVFLMPAGKGCISIKKEMAY